MTKFDFKQWVINNKYGKLNEQDARQRPRKGREMDMDMEMPPTDIGDFMPNPDDAPIDPTGPAMQSVPCNSVPGNVCHAYKECINNTPGTTYVFAMGGNNNPSDWYSNNFGSPTQTTGVGGAFTITGGGSSGQKYIYQGVTSDPNIDVTSFPNHTGIFPPPTGHAPACCGQAGCADTSATGTNDGSTVSAANTCGCDGISGPGDTSCCVYGQPEFTECQNCCCKSNIQAKVLGGTYTDDPGEFEDMEDLGESINPTIDAISKLITLAEQQNRQARMPNPDNPSGDYADPTDEPFRGGPKSPYVAPTTGPTGPPAPSGPCAASHYIPSGAPNVWNLANTFTPDPIIGNIDPATGICECNPNDPNNTFGGLTLYSGIMNPNPGTPNTTGASNGTGPCP